MRRLLTWIIAAPLAVVTVIFSIANRQIVTVDLWPFSWQIDLALFVLVLSGVGLGVVLGGIAALASGSRARSVASAKSYEAETLKRERDALKARVETLEADSAPSPVTAPVAAPVNVAPTLIAPSDAA